MPPLLFYRPWSCRTHNLPHSFVYQWLGLGLW